jgi:hypothetical protein
VTCPDCTCVPADPRPPWRAAPSQVRAALATIAPAIGAACAEQDAAYTAGAVEQLLDHCFVEHTEVAARTCKTGIDAECCSVRTSSRAVAGRKLITVRYLDIADYTAAVFEVNRDGVVRPLCTWIPYAARACDPAATGPGCGALDATWATLPAELRDYLCSAGSS